MWDVLVQKIMQNSIPVTESGCWLWTGNTGRRGYGQTVFDGKNLKAHRLAWAAFNGEIPANTLVLHRCDVTCCVNPDHLFLGTHTENMDDRQHKNRQARGTRNAAAKLSEADVRFIRSSRHISYINLAAQFSVSESQIHRVKSGKYWAHLAATERTV